MNMKFRIWIFILFLGVVVSGQDAVSPTPVSVSSPVQASPSSGAVPASKKLTFSEAIKTIKMSGMGALMTQQGLAQTRRQGNYDPRCHFRSHQFDRATCPYYKEGNGLRCYYCDDCTSVDEKTEKQTWPCLGDNRVENDKLLSKIYTGYNLGQPGCSITRITASYIKTEGARVEETATVRTCDADTLPDRCESKPELIPALQHLFNTNENFSLLRAKVTNVDKCFCKGNLCNKGTRLSGSYYNIWMFGIGFSAINSAFEALRM